MADFSDEELLFLSNLMHMKKEGEFQDIWTKENAARHYTIGQLLGVAGKDENKDGIDDGIEDTVKRLQEAEDEDSEGKKIYDGEIESGEWADMLQSIAENEDLCAMKLQSVKRDDVVSLSVCLTDAEGNAYVVFRGTSGGEWSDNTIGGYDTDTEQQLGALDYVESLPYDDITVVGHSKGGNKAKYVTIVSDKISRCVSFDGQGFSREFLEKYSDRIAQNQGKITNYALDGDFVNILLFDIGEKVYVRGCGVTNFAQNHSPNSFFCYDEMGNYRFDVEGVEQEEVMASLHLFVNYVVNTVEEDKKQPLLDYLGGILDRTMGKKPPDYVTKYSSEEMQEYLFDIENAESLGLLVAYVVKYAEDDEKFIEELSVFLEEMDFGGVATLLEVIDKYIGIEKLADWAADLSNEEWLQTLFEKFGLGAEAQSVALALSYTQSYYDKLPAVADNKGEYRVSTVVRDFSQEMKERLLGICREIAAEPWYNIRRWNALYGGEKWFGRLDISRYQDAVDIYCRMTLDINDANGREIENIFAEVTELDGEYGAWFCTQNESIQKLIVAIDEL